MWECPDLFPLTAPDGRTRWVLLVSLNPGGPSEGSATQYFIGDFDGHRFTPHDYEAFATSFGFEETADQRAAIHAVIQDMVSPKPMDRLVCGDVGFGKTEVALRAAFVAVHGGKQVALLAPTTLLAEQHYQTIVDRFSP